MGGIVSVALSLELPRVAVSDHHTLELFGLSSLSYDRAIAYLLAVLFYDIFAILSSYYQGTHLLPHQPLCCALA